MIIRYIDVYKIVNVIIICLTTYKILIWFIWHEFNNCSFWPYIFCFPDSLISNYGFIPYCRTTDSMYFCDSSGMTLDWHIRSIQMTLWTWTPQCWTPFGNLTCFLLMKREQTFTRLRQTTNCFGYSRMEMSFTASGDHVFFVVFVFYCESGCTRIYFYQTLQIQLHGSSSCKLNKNF